MRKFLVLSLLGAIIGCAAIHERNEVLHVASAGLTNNQMHGALVSDQIKNEAKESSSRPEIQASNTDGKGRTWNYTVKDGVIEWWTDAENKGNSAHEYTATATFVTLTGTKVVGDGDLAIVPPKEKGQVKGKVALPKGFAEEWNRGQGSASVSVTGRGPVFNAEDFGSGSDTLRISQVKSGLLKWEIPILVAQHKMKVTYVSETGKKTETELPTADEVKIRVTVSFQDKNKKELATDFKDVMVKAGTGVTISKELEVPDATITKMVNFVVQTKPL